MYTNIKFHHAAYHFIVLEQMKIDTKSRRQEKGSSLIHLGQGALNPMALKVPHKKKIHVHIVYLGLHYVSIVRAYHSYVNIANMLNEPAFI